MNKEILQKYYECVPKEFYRIPFSMLETDCRYYTILSERASGKTTSILIFSLLDYYYNNNTTAYVRISSDEIKQSIAQELFNVIIENKYIELCTNGTYNTIVYKWKSIYLAKQKENGEIEVQDSEPFIKVLCCQDHSKYKSVLNLPRCNTIIFDEFITVNQSRYDFFRFFDLHSTIVRKRQTVNTFLLANTIQANSLWFENLLIPDVKKMKQGDKKLFVTSQGTKNYVELLGKSNTRQKLNNIVNQLYYGFNNSQLNSITGEQTWSYDFYPNLPIEYNPHDIVCTLYMVIYSQFYHIDILQDDILGLIVYMRETEYTDTEDAITFVLSDYNVTKANELKKLGGNIPLTKFLITRYKMGLFYTDTPYTHDNFKYYCTDCKISLK